VRVEKSDSRLFRQADRFPKFGLSLLAPGGVPVSLSSGVEYQAAIGVQK